MTLLNIFNNMNSHKRNNKNKEPCFSVLKFSLCSRRKEFRFLSFWWFFFRHRHNFYRLAIVFIYAKINSFPFLDDIHFILRRYKWLSFCKCTQNIWFHFAFHFTSEETNFTLFTDWEQWLQHLDDANYQLLNWINGLFFNSKSALNRMWLKLKLGAIINI